jgi:hypothetical protein
MRVVWSQPIDDMDNIQQFLIGSVHLLNRNCLDLLLLRNQPMFLLLQENQGSAGAAMHHGSQVTSVNKLTHFMC